MRFGISAQQAPSTGHSFRLTAVQLAFSTAQRNKGGTIIARTTTTSRVSAMSNGVANRLRFIQPIGPVPLGERRRHGEGFGGHG